MNGYQLAVWALAGGLLGQTYAAGIAIESYLWRGQPTLWRRAWLALAAAAMLQALHSGYALELALRTGLYDLRQAFLACLAAIAFALGAHLLRRRPS